MLKAREVAMAAPLKRRIESDLILNAKHYHTVVLNVCKPNTINNWVNTIKIDPSESTLFISEHLKA